MQEHSGLDRASAAGGTGSGTAADRGSAAQGLLCLRDGGASETASGGPQPTSGLSGTAALHYSSAHAASARQGIGLKRPLASAGFLAARAQPGQAPRLGPAGAAGSSPASAVALAAGLGTRQGNDAFALGELAWQQQGSQTQTRAPCSGPAAARPGSQRWPMPKAATHDVRTATGFSPRPTSDAAAAGPRLAPSCGRVYLPQPSAPLPPGASPFMGALSGYFGSSPPVSGAKAPAWQPAHPQALNMQLPPEWQPPAAPPAVSAQAGAGEHSKGPARLTGFADGPSAHGAQRAAGHTAAHTDGSAAVGASPRADTGSDTVDLPRSHMRSPDARCLQAAI